jgi:hypothetical protein
MRIRPGYTQLFKSIYTITELALIGPTSGRKISNKVVYFDGFPAIAASMVF